MRALLCRTFGAPEKLTIAQVPTPEPSADEVLIDVAAAGVNFTDTLIVQNKYQLRPDLPFIPGSEAAGVVRKVGQNVRGFQPGDRVMGFGAWGAFAERMVINREKLFLIPSGFDFAEAAAFSIAYGTAYHALGRVVRMKENDTLLVLGAAGGVGLAAVHLGASMGCEVIAAAGSPQKLAALKRRGAGHTIDYARQSLRDAVKAITGSNGVDVIYDPVGGDYFDQALRLVAFMGAYLVIGFSSGRIPTVPANILLLKGIRLMGVHWGRSFELAPQMNRDDFEQLLQMAGERDLRPLIYRTYPLSEAPQAFNAILNRKVIGKIILKVDVPNRCG